MAEPHIEIETPLHEEELPLTRKRPPKRHRDNTHKINAKDSHAFWLTCSCLAAWAILCIVDICVPRDITSDSSALSTLLDTLKYVITTSLGFFFATTITRSE